MVQYEKVLPAAFFRSKSGRQPVREWLRSLTREERRRIGVDIGEVEYEWPVGPPTCKNIGNGLWEVRSRLVGGKIARVLFCIRGGNVILLHGFIKKSQKTPKNELELALQRMRGLQ